ncbi:MAG: hypothetical protein ABR562_03620 [Thermoplasmatota archaeon]|nr:hypothetical protein [Halobacteriales archaeon]
MGAARAHGDAVSARRLIFWLFVALAAATAIALLVFLQTLGDCDGDGVYDGRDAIVTCQGTTYDGTSIPVVVHRALAGDLAAPVIAWFVLSGLGASGRDRWFWFAAALPAGLMVMASTLVLLILV